jgi:hypothetical protein
LPRRCAGTDGSLATSVQYRSGWKPSSTPLETRGPRGVPLSRPAKTLPSPPERPEVFAPCSHRLVADASLRPYLPRCALLRCESSRGRHPSVAMVEERNFCPDAHHQPRGQDGGHRTAGVARTDPPVGRPSAACSARADYLKRSGCTPPPWGPPFFRWDPFCWDPLLRCPNCRGHTGPDREALHESFRGWHLTTRSSCCRRKRRRPSGSEYAILESDEVGRPAIP